MYLIISVAGEQTRKSVHSPLVSAFTSSFTPGETSFAASSCSRSAQRHFERKDCAGVIAGCQYGSRLLGCRDAGVPRHIPSTLTGIAIVGLHIRSCTLNHEMLSLQLIWISQMYRVL